MNPFLLVALILLALVSTGAYFYGSKKNRWLSSEITHQLEEVLRPTNTNYVNIGGLIGYNFTYVLGNPFINAKGTLTLRPRHSFLYLPISHLIGVRDHLFMNIFTKNKFSGEGHIIEESHLRKAKIEGLDSMTRSEMSRGNKRFILLWRYKNLEADLKKVLEALPEPWMLKHFCVYAETKSFYIFGIPNKNRIKELVEPIFIRLPMFLSKDKTQE